ncbi:LytR/AlgR family response regulator transcription factor [Labilibacter marinus]|uniref:LytR/AlgR family response regulator transcription factor n=1 Tax=Labilibacter marinus TaxID=1477105 RepID=UPI000950270C|nr:LytTR family DNA-binding domain-containing protein [Labilibacter marinus]
MSEIISCIIVDDEPMAREVLQSHLSKIENIKVLATCKNALEAFKWVSSSEVDLIFLDINMPEISGLDFAKAISDHQKIIFTTAYREYAIDGFDLRAVDYLLKPITFERLLQSIDKFMNEQPKVVATEQEVIVETKNDFFFVRSDRKMIKVDYNQILYIESLSDYIKIHLKTQSIVTRETISNIEAKLPQKDFIRTHRSYIVAIHMIESFTHEYIEMNKKTIPISRNYKSEVLNRLEHIS